MSVKNSVKTPKLLPMGAKIKKNPTKTKGVVGVRGASYGKAPTGYRRVSPVKQ